MGTGNFTDNFKRNAVTPITGRGYPVGEGSDRLGAGSVSLPAHPAEWVSCLATGTAEPARAGRQAPNRAAAEGLGGERQGLRLS